MRFIKNIIVIFLILLGTWLVFNKCDKIVVDYRSTYKNEMDNLRDEVKRDRILSGYNLLIKQGNRKLNNDNIEEARKFYQKAIDLKPLGKEANLKLTICLLIECNRNNTFCEESILFYDNMVKSNKLSFEELEELNKIKLNPAHNMR